MSTDAAPPPQLSASAVLNASAADKDELRSLRLRRSNGVKERVRAAYQKTCLASCDLDIKRYWVCRQEAGLLTPLRCGSENTAMNGCLSACARDEARFEAFSSAKIAEFEREAAAAAARAAAQRCSDPMQT